VHWLLIVALVLALAGGWKLVTVSGYLVDVRGANGFTWKTSLSRSDTGDGSCEIVWVERLETD
jgi:hypothetical protein